MLQVPIKGIEVFLAIVREGSLRGAAVSLGLSPSTVSHQLRSIEERMGVSLFARTTRSIELTAAGRVLLDGAEFAMARLGEAVEEARDIGRSKTGVLRVTLPWSAYQIVLAPLIGEFKKQHPDIRLELSFDEALVDIVRHGFHAGIRLGNRLATGMTAVRLTPPLKEAFSAAPDYIRTRGCPKHPRDLLNHNCIRYRYITTNRIAEWRFSETGREFSVDPEAFLVFDSFQAVKQALIDGHGIGWTLRGIVENEIADGRLIGLLDGFTGEQPPFYLYYPEQNRRLDLLRVLIDFLVEARR